MKKIGILQPGRLGDVIICLPIAKYYSDRGYRVIWPMFTSIATMVKEVTDYVDIFPVTEDVYRCVGEAHQVFRSEQCSNIIDIAATFPGSNSTADYVADCNDGYGPEGSDEFKYRKSNVPFDEKWSLVLNRNLKQENAVYDLYVKQSDYVVTSLSHSRGVVRVDLNVGDCQIISMNTKHSIFHWIKVLENAKGIVCVESSLSNMVDQLKIGGKKCLILKPGETRKPPVFRGDWRVL